MDPDNYSKSEHLQIRENSSQLAAGGHLVVSVTDDSFSDKGKVRITVGSPGHMNISEALSVGDFMTYNAGNHGTFEVRLIQILRPSGEDYDCARVLVTKMK